MMICEGSKSILNDGANSLADYIALIAEYG